MQIQEGDLVRHKTKIMLSGGLSFPVLEINADIALCEYFDNDPAQTMRQEWFDLSDLLLVQKAEGGFMP